MFDPATFPDPPADLGLTTERRDDAVVLTLGAGRDSPTLGFARLFMRVWLGGVILFGCLGLAGAAWLVWSVAFADEALTVNGRPVAPGEGVLLILAFAAVWGGIVGLMIWLGRRSLRRPPFTSGFRLELSAQRWRTPNARVDPATIRAISIGPEPRRLVAEVDDREVTLAAALRDDQAEWLARSLRRSLGLSA